MAQYTKDQFARRTAIIKKEAFVVSFWLLIGVLCLWGFMDIPISKEVKKLKWKDS